ncbi:MAG: GNAT family N-acetyltransferase [Saprospiraceae bacterium]
MSKSEITEVRLAELPKDVDHIKKLWFDYLSWGNGEMQRLYGAHPHSPAETVESDFNNISKFQAPDGALLLGFNGDDVCGIGCYRRIGDDTAEIKRMYVNPSFRGIGAGRVMVQHLLASARQAGYKKIRLDTIKFMFVAHALYKSMGFREIDAYPESEIPEQFRPYLLFMELDL